LFRKLAEVATARETAVAGSSVAAAHETATVVAAVVAADEAAAPVADEAAVTVERYYNVPVKIQASHFYIL
jgi:hypothetical protein